MDKIEEFLSGKGKGGKLLSKLMGEESSSAEEGEGGGGRERRRRRRRG